MPFEGLPSVLENVLRAIMLEKGLTSFSTDTRGERATVILRFSSASVPAMTARDRTTYTVKPPSRVLRDKTRAAQYQAQKQTLTQQQQQQQEQQQENRESTCGLFMPTPPSLMYLDNPSDCVMTPDNNAQAATSLHTTPPSTSADEKQNAISSNDQISLPMHMSCTPVRTELFASFNSDRVDACVPDRFVSSIAESPPSTSRSTHSASIELTDDGISHSCVTLRDPYVKSSTAKTRRDADNFKTAADTAIAALDRVHDFGARFEESSKKMEDEFAKLVSKICGNRDIEPP